MTSIYELNNTDVTWEQTLFRLVEMDDLDRLTETLETMRVLSFLTVRNLLNVKDDGSGTTLLMHCCKNASQTDVPTFLFNNGAKWDATDKEKRSVLDYINENNSSSMIVPLSGLYYIRKNQHNGDSAFKSL
jgi:hypothetical protein